MKKTDKVRFLVKLADYLDRAGESEKADFVDQIISEEGSAPDKVEINVPGDEFDFLQKVYKALGDSLK